ncbi:hypothetical protein AN964_23655 [Heyndrickxia shackletonii]|uniref:Uncharacterized protein n=1 Tax=Heyndrickxia shackletonii TaxID=157838 RepID=A0A0Q3WS08_9BACI|nr:hypothetical protein AN964_23655 [Heyndrickxia shackletonii]
MTKIEDFRHCSTMTLKQMRKLLSFEVAGRTNGNRTEVAHKLVKLALPFSPDARRNRLTEAVALNVDNIFKGLSTGLNFIVN